MKAVAVIPKKPKSAHLIELDTPKIGRGEVLVRVIRVGIDGTDSEINDGLYGRAPAGEDILVIGHESFGIVEEAGKNVKALKKGDYVVATVRRPCGECINCGAGESDMCLTGKFLERGIVGLHGFMSEYYKESPEFLVKVPAQFEKIGVFLEPLSIVEKALHQILKIQRRMKWQPKNALVLGCGSIGLLAAMLLREKNIKTYAVARSPRGCLKSKLAEKCGAAYISADDTPILNLPEKIGNIDIIIDATGSSKAAFDALQILGTNGVLCLTSITGGAQTLEIPSDRINIDMVLGNKLVFGAVNANKTYFEAGIKSFGRFEKLWPGLIERMLTKKVPLENFQEGLNRTRSDIKTVLEF